MGQYQDLLTANGYDDVEFMVSDLNLSLLSLLLIYTIIYIPPPTSNPLVLPLQNGGILEASDLHEMGVRDAAHQGVLLEACGRLPTPLHPLRWDGTYKNSAQFIERSVKSIDVI